MKFIRALGIYYKNAIANINKSTDRLRPIYEAITNSWEAIYDRFNGDLSQGSITISFYFSKQLQLSNSQVFLFDKAEVTDNGIGLTKNGYDRLKNLNDNRKHFNNKGTGRIQFIHFFDKTDLESYALEDENTYLHTSVTLSKSPEFLDKNAIIKENKIEKINLQQTFSTKVCFYQLIENDDACYYNDLTLETFKNLTIKHFLLKLCNNLNALPEITIKRFEDDKVTNELKISKNDIPTLIQKGEFKVHYKSVNSDNTISTSSEYESFVIRSFVLPYEMLKNNVAYLVSKEEASKIVPIHFLRTDDVIDGKRYIFLISGDYVNKVEGDSRGDLCFITEKDLKRQIKEAQFELFDNNVIVFDDIEASVNTKIIEMHKEIKAKYNLFENNVSELQKLFLLNPENVKSARNSISIDDNDESILRKIYIEESYERAHKSAKLKEQIDAIDVLPTDKNYHLILKKMAKELVSNISMHNRTSLSQYVAHRKIVLNLFEKILNKKLVCLKDNKRIDEDILHNLIMQQRSTNPENSDLWLLNEEFIYFSGTSDIPFEKISYNNEIIIKNNLTEEELHYLKSFNEERLKKRPDILLFPEEGKCIIIEFKAPDVNVREYLNQINFYAFILHNFTLEKFHFSRFFGYLIGESISDFDVRGAASEFLSSPCHEFWFCPSKAVSGINGRNDGEIYTEILKYSSLLNRAKARNKKFIEILGIQD